jgi:dGTPase
MSADPLPGEETLAPYAARGAESRGRRHAEPTHPFRPIYQRDRDRIVHSTAFRRLEYKTQVFVNREGDHYRTRLTHTLEVAQIGRTLARALGLNEDLTEAIALAHDLGHTPFGHSGEEALNLLMAGYGGFEHNVQGLRVVDALEKRYPRFPGLNLSYEVREAFVRHSTRWDHPTLTDEFDPDEGALLEVQVTLLADEIAYDNHDIDDGLFSGILREADLRELALWRRAMDIIGDDYERMPPPMRRASGVRALINLLATDAVETTRANLERLGIRSLADVRAAAEPVVGHSGALRKEKEELERFLHEKFYRNYRVVRMAQKAQAFLRDLFTAFVQEPKLLPSDFQAAIRESSVHRVVCDYIAGMTDRFAEQEYNALFQPFVRT